MAARTSPAAARLLRLIASAATAGALALTCAGCTGQPTPGSTTMPAPVRTTAAATPTASPATLIPTDREDAATTAGRRDATTVAVSAVAALCYPQRSAAAWWAALAPFLTTTAAEAYRSVDPGRVPCTRVVGAAGAGSGDGFTQLVTVPTDDGDCVVSLQRARPQDPWLVDRIALPEHR